MAGSTVAPVRKFPKLTVGVRLPIPRPNFWLWRGTPVNLLGKRDMTSALREVIDQFGEALNGKKNDSDDKGPSIN